MKCPPLIIIIYSSFCFKFSLAAFPRLDIGLFNVSTYVLNNSNEILIIVDDAANKIIENSNISKDKKETLHNAKDFTTDLVRKILSQKLEGEQLFLQRNCISQKFSRRSLRKYYSSTVNHLYQCESLNNGTDKFRRIIGCERGSKNFVCYGISEIDPAPEPDEGGNTCYEIENGSDESFACRCSNLFIHAGIHAISAAIVCLLVTVFYCQCRYARRLHRKLRNCKQQEDIDFDFVKHDHTNLSR